MSHSSQKWTFQNIFFQVINTLGLIAFCFLAYWFLTSGLKNILEMSPSVNPHAKFSMPTFPVETTQVKFGNISESIATSGQLNPSTSVTIKPEFPGIIQAIYFTESQPVRVNQVLFQLDSKTPYASLKQAEAQFQYSDRQYTRAKNLFKQKTISKSDLEQAQSRYEIDLANLKLAQITLEKTKILAPFSGIVGFKRVNLGDYVTPGQALIQLDRIDPIRLDFQLPERVLSKIHPNQTLFFETDAFPNQSFQAKILKIEPLIQTQTRSFSVQTEIPNPTLNLKPGLFVRVKLMLNPHASESLTDTLSETLLIPEEAILKKNNQNYVYRIINITPEQTGTVESAPVQIGLRKPGWIEILSGLKPNETIMISGQNKIQPGMTVKIKPEPVLKK